MKKSSAIFILIFQSNFFFIWYTANKRRADRDRGIWSVSNHYNFIELYCRSTVLGP